MIGNLSPNNQTTAQKGKDTEQAGKESGDTCKINKNPDVPVPRIKQQDHMRLHPFLFGL